MRGNTYIENEVAYDAAIARRIKEKASIGRRKKWEAANDDHAAIRAWATEGKSLVSRKMYEALEEWGGLTEGQTAAARCTVSQDAAKRAQYLAHAAAASQFCGAVGERLDLALTVTFVSSFRGAFGPQAITGFLDAAGNVFIAKGSPIGQRVKILSVWGGVSTEFVGVEKGQKVDIKATVKAHGERHGVKQTIIQRVKVIDVWAGEAQ